MRHLLALLDAGTPGTLAEPTRATRDARKNIFLVQAFITTGTPGTLGTLETDQAAALEHLAQRIADIADAWHERMAICLEAGDIGEAEAEITAALEAGRAFVCNFVQDQQGELP